MFWKRFSNTPDIIENNKEYCELEDNNKLPNRIWEITFGKRSSEKGFWFNFSLLFDIDYLELSIPFFSISYWFSRLNKKLYSIVRLYQIQIKNKNNIFLNRIWMQFKNILLLGWRFHYTFFCLEHSIFQTKKSYCIQLSKWEGFRTGFTFCKTACQDHPTIEIDVYFLGFVLYLYVYDSRHWNYNENRFYYDDEPEFWGGSKKAFNKKLKKFVKKFPFLEKGYYERNKR